jgi:hypothetical protein
MVDISLQVGNGPDTIEVYLHPDGDFDGTIGALGFTIRYDAGSGAILDTTNTVVPCFDGLPLILQSAYHAGYVYRTFLAFGVMTLQDACPSQTLISGQPWLVAKIPVIQWGTCTEMSIVNDAFTATNNLDYYVALNGLDRTASILSSSILTGGCGLLEGRMFQDLDGDCLDGPADVLMGGRMVTLDPLGLVTMTDAEGRFRFLAPQGNYTLTQEGGSYVESTCPPQDPVPVSFTADSVGTLHLADAVTLPFDLMVTGHMGAARAGYASPIGLVVENGSAVPSGPLTVSLTLAGELSHMGAVPFPSSAMGAVVTWNLPGLGPFEKVLIGEEAMVSAGAVPQSPLTCWVSVASGTQENDLANNTGMFTRLVSTGYVPQELQVRTSSGTSATEFILGVDEWVEYTLDFQNPFANSVSNVNIDAALPSGFDATSLEYRAVCVPGVMPFPLQMGLSPSRYLSVMMSGTVTSISVSEYGSRGFVTFRLRPVATLLPGDQLELQGRVKFGTYQSVLTNVSVLTVTSATAVHLNAGTEGPQCYPSPANDRLFVRGVDKGILGLSVLAMDGRTLLGPLAFNAGHGLDVSLLTPGVYLLRLLDPTGHQQVLRFVKE